MKFMVWAVGLLLVVGLAVVGSGMFGPRVVTNAKSIAPVVATPPAVSYPQPDENGSYAYLMDYQISFVPGSEEQEAQFLVALSNTSDQPLELLINSVNLHASFKIIRPNGTLIEAFPLNYYRLMMTSTWIDLPAKLEPLDHLTWRVPLSTLVPHLSGIEGPLTEDIIAGSEVTSEITMGVIPGPGISIPGETLQAEPIQLPTIANEAR